MRGTNLNDYTVNRGDGPLTVIQRDNVMRRWLSLECDVAIKYPPFLFGLSFKNLLGNIINLTKIRNNMYGKLI